VPPEFRHPPPNPLPSKGGGFLETSYPNPLEKRYEIKLKLGFGVKSIIRLQIFSERKPQTFSGEERRNW
jgi:hypothetical protein